MLHGIDIHYDWKNEAVYDGVSAEMVWFDEALANELSAALDVLVLVGIVCFFFYSDPECLTYELFMWGDIGLLPDIRFYGVAPH